MGIIAEAASAGFTVVSQGGTFSVQLNGDGRGNVRRTIVRDGSNEMHPMPGIGDGGKFYTNIEITRNVSPTQSLFAPIPSTLTQWNLRLPCEKSLSINQYDGTISTFCRAREFTLHFKKRWITSATTHWLSQPANSVEDWTIQHAVRATILGGDRTPSGALLSTMVFAFAIIPRSTSS